MEEIKITESIKYIGANDKTLDLFESQYIIPNGIAYNSYVIHDEKTVIMDTIDKRKTEEWLENIEKELKNIKPDYLVISHLEPDHAANIEVLVRKYPNIKLVGNKKTFEMLNQFFENLEIDDKKIVVSEGEILDIGKHKLQFFMAPMIHWPEVMFTYDQTEKVLFSADAFGKFGALDTDEDWACEARRYYFNIVGKYGVQVQKILQKLSGLEVKIICPLHGPILTENLEYYINKYNIWSSYMSEDEGVLVAYNSIHGNTKEAVLLFAEMLEKAGAKKVIVSDLARDDMAEVIEDAFRYDKLVVASPTYDAGLFPYTEKFLRHLKHKNYQKRKVGIIENGSWAPMAAKCMKEILEQMKEIQICDPIVTITSTVTDDTKENLQKLANAIIGK